MTTIWTTASTIGAIRATIAHVHSHLLSELHLLPAGGRWVMPVRGVDSAL